MRSEWGAERVSTVRWRGGSGGHDVWHDIDGFPKVLVGVQRETQWIDFDESGPLDGSRESTIHSLGRR